MKEFTNAVGGIRSFRLHTSTLDIRKYVGPGIARPVWMEDHPVGLSFNPMLHDPWDEFATEIDELRPVLTAIRDTLKSRATNASPPQAYWSGKQVQNFIAIRSAAQWLAGAAICELHQGDLEAALENLEALGALARMDRNDYRLVAQMIRVAVTGLGLATTWEALQAPGWREPQLERLQKAWEGLNLIDGLERTFVAERAHGSELWASLRGLKGTRTLTNWIPGATRPDSPQAVLEQLISDHLWLPAYKLTSIDDDELFHLQAMQEGIEALRSVKQGHSWKESKQGIDRRLNQVVQIAKSLQRFRYQFSMISLPNLSKAADLAVRGETERELTITAIALRRFQIRNVVLPKTLDDLVPTFLSQLPYDPMSGGPLSYRLKSSTDFCLYSVGEDGRDDGGDATAGTNTFGLWTGRDAVWPEAVSPRPKVEVR
jgi:hypothetical protein